MYSRKIKEMKKKLLSSNGVAVPSSKNGSSTSYELGGGGGGGVHSNWGPRVAIYEREQQEQQRRSREEQEQLYLAAKQQEIYNKSKSSKSSSNGGGVGGGGAGNGTGSMFKNPYATSGIGIHTSSGFICKANKKLMMMPQRDEDDRPRKPQPPDVPLRLRIPSPDPHPRGHPGPGISIVTRRRHASPPAPSNDSLASTKTYHSSGGSSHSSSSTLSSRGSASSIDGRSSLIVGSDHHDSHGHAMVSGNYNINGGDEDDDDEEDGVYPALHYRNRPRNGHGHGHGRTHNGRASPVLPLPPSMSTMSSSNNVKLINVHLLDEDESGNGIVGAGGARSKSGPAAGFYGKNILRGHAHANAKEPPNEKRTSESITATTTAAPTPNSKASQLIRGFNMVYVPMESTKATPRMHTKANAPVAEESDELPINSTHRRRQLGPPPPAPVQTPAPDRSESGYGISGGYQQLPEEETHHVPVPTMRPPTPCAGDRDRDGDAPRPSTRNGNVSAISASTADADSLLESFDSVLFKPQPNCSSPVANALQNGSIYEPGPRGKKTPPPLPPKTRPKVPPHAASSNFHKNSIQNEVQAPSPPPVPVKGSKNLRFSDHLDVKAPSPYTTISYDHSPAVNQAQGSASMDRKVSEEGGVCTGPMSRASMYTHSGPASAATTTTTLLSCGHLRDSYSTLSSLTSDQLSDGDNGNPVGGRPRVQDTSGVDTSIECPIGDDEDEHGTGDDPQSHKSALQQLRDLSILIGGSFHTSPMIQTATAAVAKANKENQEKYGGPLPAQSSTNFGHAKPQTQMQTRKFSTETSNDSGKGSATGSGRSHTRSEAGGSGSGRTRTNSIMQLLQNLPPPPHQQSQPHPQRQPPKVGKMHINGNSKSILAALNKIARPPNPNTWAKTEAADSHHQHRHVHDHSSGGSDGSGSCSCDDSELSSCLFQPECEECHQLFGNPFEVLPESKYIDLVNNSNAKPSSAQPKSSQKKIKVLTRKNSYKLKVNPRLSTSKSGGGGGTNSGVSSSKLMKSKTKTGPMLYDCGERQRDVHQGRNPLLKLGYNGGTGGIGTKTQLLLSKSADHRGDRGDRDHAPEIGCLGCYNEQLMLVSGGANCSTMMGAMNPANLFTIDEAAEENDGTLQTGTRTMTGTATATASSSSSKLVHGRHATANGNGTKTKKSHRSNTKYGRGKKKPSAAAKKSAHHHHGHGRHKCDNELGNVLPKHVHGHPKCWLATDGTMGWSDLESIYSQNLKALDSNGGTATTNSSGGESGPNSPNGGGPSHPQFVNGECITCWRELMQYKYNGAGGSGSAVTDPNSSYTVERTKRMFIWLNKRPKEFSEPWWEAKKQASIKWLVAKAYSHMPKGSVQHPFKESRRMRVTTGNVNDKPKLVLKDQVMAGLATGKLYCMALANLFANCTPEEQQTIFGLGTPPLKKAGKEKRRGRTPEESDDDELLDAKRSGSGRLNLSLSHWEIIKILSRKGIYVAQPSDMKLTEGTLRQRKPFRITAHIALIEAIMGLYAKVVLTRERIEPIVSNLGHSLSSDAHTSEDFILAWVNAVIDTLKAYILSANISNARRSSAGSSSSPSSSAPSGFAHHRWLNVHPIKDLRDMFDGIGLCSLFILYFSSELSFDQVCVNEPGETLHIYDSILNLNLAHDLCTQLFPQSIHHLRLTDLLYIHGYMKQNVLQLLLDIFYHTELVPIDSVSRLTHVPLRIQL